MNRYKLLIAGLLALAVVFLIMTLQPSKPTVRKPAEAESAEAKPQTGSAKPAASTGLTKAQDRAKAAPSARAKTETGGTETPAVAAPGVTDRAQQAEATTPREKAVEAWESLVDRVIAQKDVPVEEQAKVVKEAFDKLDKADQMDGIHRSLNLFPDEQFPALYGILFDKKEDPEVLDAIFSDALNRPEELKNPLMKELVKDKEHPCFFESARILDVIGELEPKPGETPTPTPAAGTAPTPTP